MADVIVSPRAADDADHIFLYLDQRSQPAADEFTDRLEAALSRLSAYPMIGAPRDDLYPGTRILVIDHYLIVHRVRDDAVEVVTIFDGRRDPKTLAAILREDRPSRRP